MRRDVVPASAAIRQVEKLRPRLATHLRNSINTGTYRSYRPNRRSTGVPPDGQRDHTTGHGPEVHRVLEHLGEQRTNVTGTRWRT